MFSCPLVNSQPLSEKGVLLWGPPAVAPLSFNLFAPGKGAEEKKSVEPPKADGLN